MIKTLETQVSGLLESPLREGRAIRRGIERETLRSDAEGRLARTPHPAFLGSKLCHPLITTDFSEVQLELITPVSTAVDQTLSQLDRLHRFVDAGLETELLWPASMPCLLPADADIPLADYGNSHAGLLKKTYREGLSLRYGRAMQTICAVHYNFSLADDLWLYVREREGSAESLADFRSRRYFDLMRNFRRFSWLPVYLFGASPVVDNSFLQQRRHELLPMGDRSHFQPHATSLRSGGLGYQSNIQASAINICYNSMANYVDSLLDAITTEHPTYRQLEASGRFRQLSTSILQYEAEFYTSVRAKCPPAPGANLLGELRRNGVQYIEVRLLDVDPYAPLGVTAEQLRLLDTLLIGCLLLESPIHSHHACDAVQSNMLRVVSSGRDPAVMLDDLGRSRSVQSWGNEILDLLVPVADLLDRVDGGTAHAAALAEARRRLRDPSTTPSGRMLDDMKTRGQSFLEFALERSASHRAAFRRHPLALAELAELRQITQNSQAEQQAIEAADAGTFAEYLQRFRQQYQDLRRR